MSGTLSDGKNEWPIVNYIPRFVPKFDYWDSFSLQWQRHPRIMNALFSGMTLYEDRFRKETRWGGDLKGQIVLEAGCGVGSFTAPALATGATVISFDVSAGVETVYADNWQNENSLVVQASIYEMPFAKTFDKVFCFGVLQHTPDPKKSFASLVSMLKPGGSIATDIYAEVPLTRYHGMLRAKYFVRRFVAGMEPDRLHRWITRYVAVAFPFFRAVQKFPRGVLVSQHFMIDQYQTRLTGMRPEFFKEFAVVDIIDMLGAAYDLPATKEEFTKWHHECGLSAVDVDYGYNGLEGRGVKPN